MLLVSLAGVVCVYRSVPCMFRSFLRVFSVTFRAACLEHFTCCLLYYFVLIYALQSCIVATLPVRFLHRYRMV